MRGKTVPTMGLALICGFAAMYGVSKMVAPAVQIAPEMRDVVVAARDLKVEEVLKGDSVAVVQMPKSSVPEGSFSEVEELKERWARIPILEGEAVVEAKLAPEGEPPGLVGRIPTGMRAFAVEVNEQTGVSGFILPGHRVDVIQQRNDIQVERRAKLRGSTILQNLQVLAAGQVTSRPDDRTIMVRTVTLAVTQEQAEILVAAKAKGPLSLTLRGMDDDTIVAMPLEPEPEPKPEPSPVVVAEVRPPAPPPRVRYRQTHVYRGFGPTGFYEAVEHRGRPINGRVVENPGPVREEPWEDRSHGRVADHSGPGLEEASVVRYAGNPH